MPPVSLLSPSLALTVRLPAGLPDAMAQEEEAAQRMGGRGLEEIAAEPVGRPEDSGNAAACLAVCVVCELLAGPDLLHLHVAAEPTPK